MDYAFDKQLAPFASIFAAADPTDLAANRASLKMVATQLAPYEATRPITAVEQTIEGPDGSTLGIRVYRPQSPPEVSLPGILHLHWGGFTTGDVDVIHPMSLRMADRIGAVVVAVKYRLAPEAPYPAALEDCYAALLWLAREATFIGVDAARIAVAGDSAGGGLAAALALLARDRGGPALVFQSLGFAELDDRLNTASAKAFTDTPMWTRGAAEVSWRHYLGEVTPGSEEVSQYAAAARAGDLTGLPPAFVSACEFDPLRDEDLHYGQRLVVAGVPVEMHLYPGTFHASTAVADAAVSQRMIEDQIGALTRALSPPNQHI